MLLFQAPRIFAWKLGLGIQDFVNHDLILEYAAGILLEEHKNDVLELQQAMVETIKNPGEKLWGIFSFYVAPNQGSIALWNLENYDRLQ